MSNLVATQKFNAPMVAAEQLEILRNTVFKGLDDAEMQFAAQVCNRTGLDPFTRQIHFVKRWNKKEKRHDIAIQTGIDGFRLQAQRSGEYAGSDDPIFDNEDQPKKATVTVYRIVQGVRVPFTATARWDEFCPQGEQDFMWRDKPCVMLGKCAEAQALRKGFPAELSSIYLQEEMQRTEPIGPTNDEKQAKLAPPNAEQKKYIDQLLRKFAGIAVTPTEICERFNIASPDQLSKEQIIELNNIGAAIKERGKLKSEFFGLPPEQPQGDFTPGEFEDGA